MLCRIEQWRGGLPLDALEEVARAVSITQLSGARGSLLPQRGADPGPRPALPAGPSPRPDRRDRDRQHLAQPPLGDTREFQLQNPG